MSLAPVILFAYQRPQHTLKSLEALLANSLSQESELHVFCDGPKPDADENTLERIRKVRETVKAQAWCSTVHVHESETNQGLASSVIQAVSNILEKHDRVIVLEDDIVVAPHFLDYMNSGLNTYAGVENVYGLSGFSFINYDEHTIPTNHFLLPRGSSWGWATWRDKWNVMNANAQDLLQQIQSQGLTDQFDYGGEPFLAMLEDQVAGRIDSWAIRYYASLFLQRGYFVFPRKTLVKNIGFDEYATHTNFEDKFVSELNSAPCDITHTTEPDPEIITRVDSDLRKHNDQTNLWQRVKRVFQRS